MEKKLYTITIFSENTPGLLNQITIIFTRRQLNIETLSVSPSSIKGVHKYTISVCCDADMIEKVIKQIEKRIDVIRAFYNTDDELVYQEIALYKVSTEALLDGNLEAIIRKHNARILEVDRVYTIIEKTGHTEETKQLFDELNEFNVLQFVRSGRIAITKSPIERLTDYIAKRESRRKELEEKA
ncbi:MAG: acetolactate synthase small subunit [Bacteroidales bacterium]|jgi:acetolactate synthase-1/3 small subunit|nr:acetolactate synthase small subunit [Bacteroidales bacterium]MDD6357553.1 acetolactate synthase small subunit [Bacteroidales bacterium]